MSRTARQKSASGIYHIMLRGLDRMAIFFEDADRGEFMDRLARYKEECGYSVYAFALMQNHVHLLLKEGETGLSDAMKRLTLSYSFYFNRRYDRCGYLFQGRYLSEPVDTSEYLLSVIRYIHNNPVEVGQDISSWTSYGEFAGKARMVSTDEVLALIDPNSGRPGGEPLNELIAKAPPLDRPLGYEERRPVSDAQALEMIGALSGLKNPLELGSLDKAEREELIAMLRKRRLSVRQISRLTGITRGIVQRVKS